MKKLIVFGSNYVGFMLLSFTSGLLSEVKLIFHINIRTTIKIINFFLYEYKLPQLIYIRKLSNLS